MSYYFLERKDPRVDVLFQGLENMERLIAAMEDAPKSVFHGERFLTDEELSKILRVSRRTLQEYRTLGVIPYYLVQGKALDGLADERTCHPLPVKAYPGLIVEVV